VIERTPPPRGGFLFSMFPDQEPRGRGPPPEEPPPKLNNFGGGSSGGVLFLRVLDLETTQQRNPPGGVGSFDQSV